MSSVAYTLRVATPSDAAAVSAIAARTFSDTFAHLYSAEDLNNYLNEAYDVSVIRSELEDPKKYTVLVFPDADSETPCGYAMLHDGSVRTGDDRPPEDYYEVKRVYVDKPYIGKGAGRVLMDHVMEIVKQMDRKITWLGVWENNFHAQKFYQKYGFVETGEHTFMVGAVADRDLLYTLQRSDSK
jgi:diamine N-acetyltransferase